VQVLVRVQVIDREVPTHKRGKDNNFDVNVSCICYLVVTTCAKDLLLLITVVLYLTCYRAMLHRARLLVSVVVCYCFELLQCNTMFTNYNICYRQCKFHAEIEG